MVKNPHNLVVGQGIYYVPHRHNGSGNARHLIITKIGNKWATCGENRGYMVSLASLEVDGEGFTSPGRCYLTKKIYDDTCRLNKMWEDTLKLFAHRYSRPAHITEQDIIDITAIMERGQ